MVTVGAAGVVGNQERPVLALATEPVCGDGRGHGEIRLIDVMIDKQVADTTGASLLC